jgi:hypothetical protein
MIPGKIDIEIAGWKRYVVDHLERKLVLLSFIRIVNELGGGKANWSKPAWKIFDDYARKALVSRKGKKYMGVCE